MIDKNVYFSDENASYEMLITRSLEFGAYLKANTITEVRIFLSSSFEFCVALFGAMIAQSKAFILADEVNSNVNDLSFKDFKAQSESEFKLDMTFKFFLYTSGSSGKAKSIEKSLQDMFEEAMFLRDFLNLEHKKVIASVSNQHMFGLSFKIFLPLVAGFTIISQRLSIPEFIESYDFTDTIFISSPTLLEALKNYRITSLNHANLIITAGSKLNDDLRLYFQSKIMEIYGSTETGVVAVNFGEGFRVFDSVNVSLDKERLRISSKWCKDFLSLDKVELQGKNLKLLGRFDRILKINEMQFNLDEAENAIKQSPLIKDSKCALLQGEMRIRALLLLSDKGKEEFRNNGKMSIIQSIQALLPTHFKTNIRHFKIISSIPLNDNAKLSLTEFQRIYDEKTKPHFLLDSQEQECYKFSAFMQEDCFFFAGHFRDFPITAGFIQLDFVFECLGMIHKNVHGQYNIENLKFSAFLRPCDICKIEINIQDTLIYFRIYANGNLCTQGRIRSV